MKDFSQARKNMVDCQIHTNGVVSAELLNVFSSVPRELFVPEKLQDVAYTDEELDIGQGRALLSPIVHAKMLQAVLPNESDVVLDIACGYGYSSAVLAPLVSTVVACETNKQQSDKAVRTWEKNDVCNVVLSECDDLSKGVAAHAPYSLIIINGAVSEVPECILEQLDFGGRLVTILRDSHRSQAVMYKKDQNGHIAHTFLFDAYAPYIQSFVPKSKFQF